MAYIKRWRQTNADVQALVTIGNSDDENGSLIISNESDNEHDQVNLDVGGHLEADSDLETTSDNDNAMTSDSSVDPEINDNPVENIPQSLNEDIASWATGYGITRNALNSLLAIIRKHNCEADIPKDPRTLLRTPREIPSVLKC